MNKIVLVFVVITLLIGGIFFRYRDDLTWFTASDSNKESQINAGQNSGTTLSPEEREANRIRRQNEEAISITNSAILNADPAQCEFVPIDSIKLECIKKSAISSALKDSNVKMCDLLQAGDISDCKDQVYYKVAYNNQDLDKCKQISNSDILSKCNQDIEAVIFANQKEEISEGKLEKSECDTYTDTSIAEECRTQIDTTNNQSTFEEAMNTNDSDICSSISDATVKQNCYDGLQFSEARSSSSLVPCDKILNPDMKSQCILTVTSLIDSEAFQSAIQKNSITDCSNIISEELRTTCIDRIRISEIVSSGKREDCALLKNKELQESCNLSFPLQ